MLVRFHKKDEVFCSGEQLFMRTVKILVSGNFLFTSSNARQKSNVAVCSTPWTWFSTFSENLSWVTFGKGCSLAATSTQSAHLIQAKYRSEFRGEEDI